MREISRRELVSHGDLYYQGTVKRREGGFPVGDGEMGAMVFTSPSAIKFAVNRCDVFAANSYTNSFNRRHSDYGYGIGFVDVDFVDYGEDVFDADTRQHLGLYEACAELHGRGVKARVSAKGSCRRFPVPAAILPTCRRRVSGRPFRWYGFCRFWWSLSPGFPLFPTAGWINICIPI